MFHMEHGIKPIVDPKAVTLKKIPQVSHFHYICEDRFKKKPGKDQVLNY